MYTFIVGSSFLGAWKEMHSGGCTNTFLNTDLKKAKGEWTSYLIGKALRRYDMTGTRSRLDQGWREGSLRKQAKQWLVGAPLQQYTTEAWLLLSKCSPHLNFCCKVRAGSELCSICPLLSEFVIHEREWVPLFEIYGNSTELTTRRRLEVWGVVKFQSQDSCVIWESDSKSITIPRVRRLQPSKRAWRQFASHAFLFIKVCEVGDWPK